MTNCVDSIKQSEYPRAKKVDTVDTYFGHEVADPYRWLEDDNSEETALWVDAENKVTHDYLSQIPFREDLEKRLTEIWNYPKYGIPFQKGGNYFFFKNNGIQNQSVLYITDDLDKQATVLLNPNLLAEDGTVALAGMGVSEDGKYLAYSIASGGSDWNEIFVMRINDRKMTGDHINWVKFSGISWWKDGFFYSSYDKPKEGDELSGQNKYHKVYYHKLGQPQEDDLLIFEDTSHPLRNFQAYLTKDKSFLLLSETESTSGNSLYASRMLDLESIDFKKIAEGFQYDYSVLDNIGDNLLIKTNHRAPNGKLILSDFNDPGTERWTTLVAEKDDVLEGASIVGGKLFAQYLKDASNVAFFYDLEGNQLSELKLPAIGSLNGFNGEKDSDIAFYGFTSFTYPSSVYKFDLDTYTSELYKTSEVDFDPDLYTTKQVFYASKDGTEVPMFIVHKKVLSCQKK